MGDAGPGPADAFWIVERGRGEIRRQMLGTLGPGQVRVRARAGAISRGTESLVFRGRVPPSQYEVMRCPFQEGEFPVPVKYGYCSVGVIEAGPGAGGRVFCLHPHQTRYDVPASFAVPIPDSVPDARATLAANLETAINGLWDAGPRLGDRIAVIGAGLVGLLSALLASDIPGTEVEVIEPDPARAEVARDLGLAVVAAERATRAVDLVIHASGNPAGLPVALDLAGFEATVLELSWFGDQPVTLPLGEAFHSRRLRLIGSQVGAVAAERRARRGHRDRLQLALSLLADPRYDRLIGGSVAFADLPQRFPDVVAGRLAGPGILVRFD